jgi:hypothetical protein
VKSENRPLTVDEGDNVDERLRHALICLREAGATPTTDEKVEWLKSAMWDLFYILVPTDPRVSAAINERGAAFLEKIFGPLPKKEG